MHISCLGKGCVGAVQGRVATQLPLELSTSQTHAISHTHTRTRGRINTLFLPHGLLTKLPLFFLYEAAEWKIGKSIFNWSLYITKIKFVARTTDMITLCSSFISNYKPMLESKQRISWVHSLIIILSYLSLCSHIDIDTRFSSWEVDNEYLFLLNSWSQKSLFICLNLAQLLYLLIWTSECTTKECTRDWTSNVIISMYFNKGLNLFIY